MRTSPSPSVSRLLVGAAVTDLAGPATEIQDKLQFVLGPMTGSYNHDRNQRNRQEVTLMSSVPSITLNDGHTIPQLGFGVFQIKPDQTAAAVHSALEVGYRHIDTAEMYGNEKQVGQGIRDAGVDRREVFITSKLNNRHHRPDDAR